MMISFNPYSVLIDLKNYLYNNKIINQTQVSSKVISIGNLNTGGTGKTPLIRFISKIFDGKKILIVCKSYKADLKTPQKVDINQDCAVQIFGDEACLLKQLLPQCDIWSGPSKSETIKTALQFNSYDVVLIDDGFSHRKIFRNLDIVLVDASRANSHYRLFPLGHMREDWKTLQRSDLVILTKTEGVSDERLSYFENLIRPFQKHIIKAKFKSVFNEKSPKSKKLFLITGIGNPEHLKSDLESQGYEIVNQKSYPDHYSFPIDEQIHIHQIIYDLQKKKSDISVVMTCKDFTKITYPDLKNIVVTVEVEVSLSESDRKIFYDQILS
jgi:tetraacyldisaccharide 4'-kinase